MPNINEYTTQLIIPQYTPTSYDPTLEIQVAMKKQQNYNRVLDTVKGLQSQALNIQMLNQEGRQRLDQYNKELNDKLSGDLGDLTKIEVQNNIANMFQRIAGDSTLAKASQLSSEYQKQLDTIESFRQSGRKDRGYNSINETVFKEWDGGLYDFMGSSLDKVTSPSYQSLKYVPFKELDTKLLNIAKSLHADTQISEGPSGSEGYLVHKELTQVSPEKIREMMTSQFDQEDLEQLDVMSKYEIIQTKKLGQLPYFYQKYNQYADNEIGRTKAKADSLKQQANYYTNLINSKTTPEEKKAEYIELVNTLKEQSKLFENRAFSLTNSKKNYSDFEKMSNGELLEYAKEMQWNNKIESIADALSWKKEVEMYKPDQVWMFNKKMDVIKWQEQVRASTKLALKRMSGEGKVKEPEFSGKMDTVENPIGFFDSYQTLTGMQQDMSNLTNRIITAPSFNPSSLLDKGWLQSHKDNYEVKMWDVFSHQHPDAVVGNKPQLEAFKLWLKDQEANPQGTVAEYITQQQRNEKVSDWLDKKVMEINQATRKNLNEFDLLQGYPIYDSEGKPISKSDYEQGKDAYLGVPTKSGIKLMKVDDVIEEVKKGKEFTRNVITGQNIAIQGSAGIARPLVSALGAVSNSIPSTRSEYTGQITDKGLVDRIEKLAEKRNQSNPLLEKEMIGRLPQIFQTGMVEAMNDEAKQIYWPDVASSAKNANKDSQFGIAFDDVDIIRPPITGNKGQFRLKAGAAEKYKGFNLPDAADPNKLIPIREGVTYSFLTNKPYMPNDYILNEVVKDEPFVTSYKGYTINLSKSDLTDNMYVRITDSKGQTINSGERQGGDVNQIIKAMHQYIDTLK